MFPFVLSAFFNMSEGALSEKKMVFDFADKATVTPQSDGWGNVCWFLCIARFFWGSYSVIS